MKRKTDTETHDDLSINGPVTMLITVIGLSIALLIGVGVVS